METDIRTSPQFSLFTNINFLFADNIETFLKVQQFLHCCPNALYCNSNKAGTSSFVAIVIVFILIYFSISARQSFSASWQETFPHVPHPSACGGTETKDSYNI